MNSTEILLDATPQIPQDNGCFRKKLSKDLKFLNDISTDKYISIFFLLIDYLKDINFLSITKKIQPQLKFIFCQLYDSALSEEILIELFGTLKLYNYLKYLNSCLHIYKVREKKLNKIDKIWKFLYSLCEEISDADLNKLKDRVPECKTDQISSAEEFFYFTYERKIITKYDVSGLKRILYDFPACLNLLCQYEDEPRIQQYLIKTPTKVTPCGIACIYNFVKFDHSSGLTNRDGSEIDVVTLVTLWESYGFITRVLKNLTSSEFKNSFNEISEEDHSKFDAFVCCILSHGESNAVYASDGKKVSILELISPLTNKCSSLDSKPKLFFIQACQGNRIQSNSPVVTNTNSGFINPQAPDLCIINSTLPGYASYRSRTEGGWFVQTLNRVMQSFKKECSIHDVMCEVSKEMKDKQFSDNGITLGQISSTITTTTKTLVLRRKLL